MRLCTFVETEGGAPRAGMCLEGRVHDLARVTQALRNRVPLVAGCDYSSLICILGCGKSAMDSLMHVRQALEQGAMDVDAMSRHEKDVKLLAPLPRPNSIRDFLVFEAHLLNAMHTVARKKFPPAAWLNSLARKVLGRPLLRPPQAWYRIPAYYKGNHDSVIGPGEPIQWPSYTEQLDYELEFGLYIHEPGRDIREKDAMDHVAGFTIFNDVSARDIQMKEMSARLGPAKGKDFDTGNVMGPWLVTPDEVGDPHSLTMEAFVNNERWSSGNSRDMRFSFAEIIAYVSRSETLHPGDFLGSGTVGTGCGLELDRWIKPGDVITLKVAGLGELTNPVVRDGAGRGT